MKCLAETLRAVSKIVKEKNKRIAQLEAENAVVFQALELAHPHMCECDNEHFVRVVLESRE